jgi:hypothetical protein
MFVYAPVGLALTVAEDLPGLIAKGRQRVETEISNARVVGQFTVAKGQRDLTSLLGGLLHGTEADEIDQVEEPEEGVPPSAATPRPAPDPADTAVVETALEGYDTLSASQVVRRLESLGPDELQAVHRYEASHRNRRTILNRTNQLLQLGSPPAAAAD